MKYSVRRFMVVIPFWVSCGGGGTTGNVDGGLVTDARAARETGTQTSTDSANAVPPAAVAAGCRAKKVSMDVAFPGTPRVSTSHGSALAPDATGGTITDGTYVLATRTMRGSGSVPSSERAVMVFKGNALEFMKWHISPQPETSDEAWAGTVTTSGIQLDLSGMVKCWGSSSLPSQVQYTATETELMLRFGVVDYTLRKK